MASLECAIHLFAYCVVMKEKSMNIYSSDVHRVKFIYISKEMARIHTIADTLIQVRRWAKAKKKL